MLESEERKKLLDDILAKVYSKQDSKERLEDYHATLPLCSCDIEVSGGKINSISISEHYGHSELEVPNSKDVLIGLRTVYKGDTHGLEDVFPQGIKKTRKGHMSTVDYPAIRSACPEEGTRIRTEDSKRFDDLLGYIKRNISSLGTLHPKKY